eukprot:15454716-Alexandrium_andersonii.AAC.1
MEALRSPCSSPPLERKHFAYTHLIARAIKGSCCNRVHAFNDTPSSAYADVSMATHTTVM